VIEIWIPELPPAALSPNGAHGHWRNVADARRWLRAQTGARALGLVPYDIEALPRARVSVIAYVCRKRSGIKYQQADRYRPEDVPNLISALKPVYDGLVDAGILEGDRAGQMVLGEHDIRAVEDHDSEGLAITIEALDSPTGATARS
jgi:hypothetical protein